MELDLKSDAERMCNLLGIRYGGIMWKEYCRRNKLTAQHEVAVLRKLLKGETKLMLTPDGFYYVS